MSRVKEFQKLMVQSLVDESFVIREWAAATARRDNLLEINTKDKPTVLYVKGSNTSPYRWGLREKRIDLLERSTIRWFVVLLLNSNDKGFILTSDEVLERIQDGTFELSRARDYKVHEYPDLKRSMAFRGRRPFSPIIIM